MIAKLNNNNLTKSLASKAVFLGILTAVETSVLPVRAALITIDFQKLVNNQTLPTSTVITNQFSSQGVVFSLENVINPNTPGPIADTFGDPDTAGIFNTFNYNVPILADFSVPVTTVKFTSIVDSPLNVKAFDASGALVGTASILGGSVLGEISTPVNIAQLQFLNDSGTGYGNRSDLTIVSSLSYVAVPEPSLALGLFAFGVLGGILPKRKLT